MKRVTKIGLIKKKKIKNKGGYKYKLLQNLLEEKKANLDNRRLIFNTNK